MDKYFVTLILFFVSLLGGGVLICGLQDILKRQKDAVDFLNNLKNYIRSNGKDLESYSWLLNRSNRMQNQMGSDGVYGYYSPPYKNYRISNYPIILNMLPDLREAFENNFPSVGLISQYSNSLQEAIIRYIGSIEDGIEEQKSKIKNPFIWLREGFRKIIAFPLSILGWLGIITEFTVYKITSNFIFKTVSGIVAFLGFLSAIVTLVLGWKDFYAFIINKIF